jgi:hypothetical protein
MIDLTTDETDVSNDQYTIPNQNICQQTGLLNWRKKQRHNSHTRKAVHWKDMATANCDPLQSQNITTSQFAHSQLILNGFKGVPPPFAQPPPP